MNKLNKPYGKSICEEIKWINCKRFMAEINNIYYDKNINKFNNNK